MADQEIASITEPVVWRDFVGRDSNGPYLIGGRCARCNFITLGVRRICPECWREGTMQPARLGRYGELYSYTVLHQMAAGFDVPAAVGYLDVEESVRVFAHLENTPETLRIGARLQLDIAPLRAVADGAPLAGPRYRAAGGDGGRKP